MLRLIAVLIITIVMNNPLASQEQKQQRQISMDGEASMMVAPDMASISIGVETEGTSIADFKRDNDQRVSSIYEAVKGLGIPDKDIQTSELSIQPIYDYSSKRRKFLRYEMRNVVTITVRKLDIIEKVINVSVREGSNVLEGVLFIVSNRDALVDSLQVEAAKNARKRASDIASAVGAKLGKALTIAASRGEAPEPIYGRRAFARMDDGVGNEASTPVSGGEMKLRSSVSVMFELE
jgi:uncharacterized protein YggE